MFAIIGKIVTKLMGGSRNDRIVRARMKFIAEEVNPLEPRMRGLSDDEMKALSAELRSRLERGESRDSVKPEAFALIREASRRSRNHRQFDVQLAAGMILDEGRIAEEATGEGKTIACYPAIYLTALEGLKVHVVTTNDVLVQRDADFAQPIFELLGITVGYITSPMDNAQRQANYGCDVTYGTNSEFGFDYLRDNMKLSTAEQVQGQLGFAIVDEVDSILIDEARTPLIISGAAHGQTERFSKVDAVARELISRHRGWDRANSRVESLQRSIRSLTGEVSRAKDADKKASAEKKLAQAQQDLAQAEEQLDNNVKFFEIERDNKSVNMTHEGVGAAQDIAGVGSFYVGANMEWPHLMSQALRAHLVFERDTDYVVRDGAVVIVDEFTGRMLEGRQWSDGLHQAVEAKERVPIKEETQTLATITIQNYFKLYKKLAGMTGTAMTEAEEFMKIYSMDSVAVTTHRPINRVDHNDRIYSDVAAKFEAVVEEVNRVSKLPRPVLVGTTSIEKSEMLSEMLTRNYGVAHEVLNGRMENAARENEIVAKAGQLAPLKKDSKQMVGNVTIATNMAGRGTDIKLGAGVVHDKCRVPDDEEMLRMGLQPEALFPAGSNKCCISCKQYDAATNCAHCFKPKLDSDFPARGRDECPAEVPCGLHIVGTERHEARRIDNQLRGRAGRQGDPGSSRFFLSLRDDLMSIFAGEWTLKVLGWLGLQGDVAIEDRRVSKGVERAQRKVEERNFETRKNLLEYDEVMDHQRHAFYDQRQKILQGRGLEGLVNEMIEDILVEAADNYLTSDYAKRCIAEWASQTLQMQMRPDQVNTTAPEELESLIDNLRTRAKDEAYSVIAMTLGEYMDEDIPAREWDLKGLIAWAMSRFGVSLTQNQLQKMDPHEVETQLSQAAAERIDQLNLSAVAGYLDEQFPRRAMAQWMIGKFDIEVELEELDPTTGDVAARLMDKVQQAYARREIEYPVEHALDMTVGPGGTDNVYAVEALAEWANRKYSANLQTDDLRDKPIDEIRDLLVEMSEQWTTGGRLEQEVRDALGSDPTPEASIALAKERFDTTIALEDIKGNPTERVISAGKRFLRREMTELERFVLLQIYDSSWKDHLLAMDHLKSGIGLRSYAEQDPRVAYKREGANLFAEMQTGVREKVTDMIFKVRLAAGAEVSNVYQISSMVHEQLSGYDHLAQDMADQQAAAAPQKIEQIRRDVPKVGRNDPCPCGSGKKYKKCCGKI